MYFGFCQFSPKFYPFEDPIAMNLGKQLIALVWLPCGTFAKCYL